MLVNLSLKSTPFLKKCFVSIEVKYIKNETLTNSPDLLDEGIFSEEKLSKLTKNDMYSISDTLIGQCEASPSDFNAFPCFVVDTDSLKAMIEEIERMSEDCLTFPSVDYLQHILQEKEK